MLVRIMDRIIDISQIVLFTGNGELVKLTEIVEIGKKSIYDYSDPLPILCVSQK